MDAEETARDWVDALLVRLNKRDQASFVAEAVELPPAVQVAVLRDCVRRMPSLRSDDYRHPTFAAGSALYGLACHLYYQRKLPFDEGDICALLESSRHTCGHGSDVTPPLDIAHAYMQKHGFSERILSSVRQFVGALSGVSSSHANFAKRRAAIMLLADPSEGPGSESGWSSQFREGLRNLSDHERAEWQRLVLSMKANDVYVQPAVWQKSAARLVETLTPDVVLERINGWISVSDQKQSTVKTGASHVLKHFVWILDTLSADDLVIRLARIDWSPKERAAKFMIAAAYSLSRRPPAVAWDALQDLLRWNGATEGKIRDVVAKYARQHDLPIELTPPVSVPHQTHLPEPPPKESLIARWLRRIFGSRKFDSPP